MKSILRLPVHTNNYTIIHNPTIADKELTFASTGLLMYLLSLPDDWVININDIANRKKTSKYEVRKLLNELKNRGYVTTNVERDKNGKIITVRYKVNEISLLDFQSN